jgi:hypothetical protein
VNFEEKFKEKIIGIRLEERLLLGLEKRLCDIRAITST